MRKNNGHICNLTLTLYIHHHPVDLKRQEIRLRGVIRPH